jgi:hypothetical protein
MFLFFLQKKGYYIEYLWKMNQKMSIKNLEMKMNVQKKKENEYHWGYRKNEILEIFLSPPSSFAKKSIE